MKKVLLLSFLLWTSCSQISPSHQAALNFIKSSQNEDGSWGDRNKIFCTSLAVLCYFESSESNSSSLYGESILKGLRYLIKNENAVSKADLHFYMWAISRAYALSGIKNLKVVMERKATEFRESIFWNYREFPQHFIIQTQALHSYRMSGGNMDFEFYLENLKRLPERDSLVISALKRQWAFPSNPGSAVQEKIVQNINRETNFIDDMLLGRYLFFRSDHTKTVKFKNKIEHYLNGKNKYKFDERYSSTEKNLLETVCPKLVYEFSFPLREIPTSKAVFPDDETEGLNLVK